MALSVLPPTSKSLYSAREKERVASSRINVRFYGCTTVKQLMKSPFVRILLVQSAVTTLITSCLLLMAEEGALSVFLAGVSCILPTLFVTFMSLRPTPFGKSGYRPGAKRRGWEVSLDCGAADRDFHAV